MCNGYATVKASIGQISPINLATVRMQDSEQVYARTAMHALLILHYRQ